MPIDFSDPAVLAELEKAGYVPESEVKGLKAKKDELLAKVANSKTTVAELEKAKAQLKEFEEQKLKKEENWQELEARLLKEKSDLEASLNEQNANLKSALIADNLTSELVKANVAPHFMEAAKAMLKPQVMYEDSKMMAEGKPLGEYISEWAASDSGKHFVSAPANSGGGAPGGSGGGSAKTITREQFEGLAPQARSDFLLKEGGKVEG